jgi:L-lactate utilization protein LutB
VADGGGGFMEAVKARIDATIDACTRCGKCVEACPMVEPAGLDPANGVAIAEGVIDLLAGGSGTPDAERWAQVCTNSGKCIPACDYGVNPRFMVNMARIASMNLRQGEAEVRRGAQQYFNTMAAAPAPSRGCSCHPRCWSGSRQKSAPPMSTRHRTSSSTPVATSSRHRISRC